MAAGAGVDRPTAGLRRLIGAVLYRVSSLFGSRFDREFDPAFYRSAYPDLSALKPAQLHRHYVDHGRPEGRFGGAAALIRSLERDHEPLSPDFDLAVYRLHNPDIGAASDLDLLVHYFKHGRAEGRTSSGFHPAFYRNLYHPDWPMDPDALEADLRAPRATPRYASLPEMLGAHGFKLGAWVRLVRGTEFRILNQAWAGAVETREQALLAFVREGWTRLAPLSLESLFDPNFYRETHPQLEALDDPALYKDWLLRGVELGESASATRELQRLGVELTTYPASFPWQAYVQRHQKAGSDRWSALAHLVAAGFDALAVLADAPDGRDLLLALGDAYAKRGDDRSAIAAMQRARDLAPLAIRTRQHLADAYYRLGIWREALALYEDVVHAGAPTAWTVANGARCAREMGDARRAFQLLRDSQAQLGGEQLWLATVREVVGFAFDAQAYLARALYAQDHVAEGHAVLERAVQACVDQLVDLAPLGVAIPASEPGRVVILANQDLRQCTHYRVEQKAELLETAGRAYEIFDQSDVSGFLQALPGASAAIFYRVPALPGVVEAIVTARILGVVTYYEIDDLIFDAQVYPAPIETYGGLLTRIDYDGLRFGVPLYRSAMGLCDYGLASTRPLADRMAPVVRGRESFVIANGLDSLNQPLLDRPRHRRVAGRDMGPGAAERIRIFYGSGTLAHNSDFLELAGPALLELLETDARVRLVIVGYLALGEAFEPFEARIDRIGFLPDARAYWTLLDAADINLAVLEQGAISDCKSEIKWLEAAVFAIPSVVTPTAAYRAVLTDGEDVMFADGVKGWRHALRTLVQDETLRERIGASARATAARRFSLAAGAAALEQALTPADAAAGARRAGRTKPRLMLVNVYFPPQTIGGATRVVRDNIDSWIASGAAQAFDMAVVASDHEAHPAGRLRVDSYRGLPVFRISTPMEVNMDWRPLNPEIGWMFGELLALWKPDLVHFHAPQRLTASCVEACRDAGVPYLATVHDAWWISDWQFLTDDDGRLQTPGRPLLVASQSGVTPARSQARLARLREDLEGAEAVLAVSETFAEVYRQAGIVNTIAVPNGLPHLRAVARRPSPSGRVRLGHLGSMSLHKGYHLIRAALQRGAYRNLELTIVDHARTDRVEHQLWGATPVKIIGKVQQSAVDELYAELDVLLAPSIWPESYGLVVREALNAGLWVVASDLGAMGEDVTPGMNGFVIDVSSADALAAALDEIDRHPDRYLQPPLHRPKLRTADDQAADLLTIYRTILARQTKAQPTLAEPADSGVESVAG